MKRAVLLSLAPLLLFLASTASAQGIPSVGDLVLTPSSYNPTPGQKVTIQVKSYLIDIDSANITWTSGGKTIASGIGATSATVEAPKLGSRTAVNVSVTTPDGSSQTSSISISSGAVDLILEPDGYVPPFFRGKLAPTYQNSVKIVAVPHLANSAGVRYRPETLVYNWQQESRAIPEQSGYGKQSVTIPGTIVPRPYLVTVTVSTRDGSAQGSGSIQIEPGPPSLSFYRNDPQYGPLFNRAISGTLYLGSQRESGVLGVPYGFNLTESDTDGLSYVWMINGRERPELAGNPSVTLRSPTATAGSSNVKLTIEGGVSILQRAAKSFSVVWNSEANSGSQPATVF